MKFTTSLFSLSKAAAFRRLAWKGFTVAGLLALISLAAAPALGAPVKQQVPQAPAVGIGNWTYEVVEAPKYFSNMGDRSLRFRSNGLASIAYGGDHLYYAANNGTNWDRTTVDPNFGVGQYASLAFDSNGLPRISYYDYTNGALKFAYFNGNTNTWKILVFDNPTHNAYCTELAPAPTAVRANQKSASSSTATSAVPSNHPVFHDAGAQQPQADPLRGTGLFTSVVVDPNNRVHISYYDADLKVLKYATFDGNSCQMRIIDGDKTRQANYDVGLYTSIALNQYNQPDISYFDEKYDQLKFAEQIADQWYVSVIDGSGVGLFTSLFMQGSVGEAHISYYDFVNHDLKYASRTDDGSGWDTTTIDSDGDVGGYTSIAADVNGNICISYFDFTNEDLKYVCTYGNNWNGMVVDTIGRVGRYTSLALDPNKIIHMTYLNSDTGELIYATYDGTKWSKWYQPVDVAGANVGRSSSLSLTAAGVPWIGYYDETRQSMKYANKTGATWNINFVAGGPHVGQYSDLKLDSQGNPRVAFYDSVDKFLVYGWWAGTSWAFQTVDNSADVGQFVSMAIDSLDRPHIAYYDATNHWLKYATYKTPGTWIIKQVDPSATQAVPTSLDVGMYASIAIGPGNLPGISYFDATNTQLRYAYLTPLEVWNVEVADNTGNAKDQEVGKYTSLFIDQFNNPHISYYTTVYAYPDIVTTLAHGLRYAARGPVGSPWYKIEVDGMADPGKYSSLALTPSGQPYISYYEETSGDLKLAVWNGKAWALFKIDTAGDVGTYTSLVLDSAGNPHISYHDITNGALKYASGTNIPIYLSFAPMLNR